MSNNAQVSSAALTELKTDLASLSKSLHEVYDLMTADLSQIGETWRDSKYDDFRKAYGRQIQECENIADNYDAWCKTVLEPAIDSVAKIENTSMTTESGGGATGSGSGGSDDRKVVSRPNSSTNSSEAGTQRPRPSQSENTNVGSRRPSPRGNTSQPAQRPSPIQRPSKFGGRAR